MGTLKYINPLLHIDIHLQRVKYIINEQSMNINVFLLFFSFVFLQLERERERERVYKIGYKEKQSQGYLSYFLWWSSCGESFLFYGLIDFMLFLTLAWRKWLLQSEIFLYLLLPGVLALALSATSPVQQLTFYFLFPLTGRSPHFRFRVPANRLASTFFLPMSGDPSEVTKYQHLLVSPWPTFFLNGHSLTACYC